MSKRQRWTTSLPCDCIFTLHQLHPHVMHWHGNIYPSVATWLTSEGPWVIWENTEACWTCQRCKVAGNNPGPINMFAVHQTVSSFCIRVGKQLALYQRDNFIWKSSVNFSWLWRFQPKFPSAKLPQTAFQSFPKDDQLIKVGPEYVQTSGEPFVYYHKAVL